MGLAFSSPLGVAAGIERTGERLGSLELEIFGHIEIGTFFPNDRISLAERPSHLRVGINFGSARLGLDRDVIADYLAALRQVQPFADYLCANLSAPRAGRDGNSAEVRRLLSDLRAERDRLAARNGRRTPLLVKFGAGMAGAPFPAALQEAKDLDLDGIVLVCADLVRIAEVRAGIEEAVLISVGGVRGSDDVVLRLGAGADLVQTHNAFAEGGAAAFRHCAK
ncbi:dihydroorotate oxidase [Rhodoblastus sp.]|jgi:dihydroorotate dehydrogenase|uniref:dihydroorotate oxidase n=1 Tax=Rhodoblastus sp. TaxID=1962975 RepID=UPI0025CEEB1B|nr:dihydroorotate oxidase [Rhodoblastus sp.]